MLEQGLDGDRRVLGPRQDARHRGRDQERRVGLVEPDAQRVVVDHLDAVDARPLSLVELPATPDLHVVVDVDVGDPRIVLVADDLPAPLDVVGREGRPVVEDDAAAQLEDVLEPVLAHRPRLREVGLRLVGVVVEPGEAVEQEIVRDAHGRHDVRQRVQVDEGGAHGHHRDLFGGSRGAGSNRHRRQEREERGDRRGPAPGPLSKRSAGALAHRHVLLGPPAAAGRCGSNASRRPSPTRL